MWQCNVRVQSWFCTKHNLRWGISGVSWHARETPGRTRGRWCCYTTQFPGRRKLYRRKICILDSRLREREAFSFAYQNYKTKDTLNTTASRQTHGWLQNTSHSPVCWLWAIPVSLHLEPVQSLQPQKRQALTVTHTAMCQHSLFFVPSCSSQPKYVLVVTAL